MIFLRYDLDQFENLLSCSNYEEYEVLVKRNLLHCIKRTNAAFS